MQPEQIEKLARLAKLKISQETLEQTARSINDVLALVDQLQSAETGDITPMAHPLDAIQILREDRVTESDQREKFQRIAPAVEDGLYLVPKVIE